MEGPDPVPGALAPRRRERPARQRAQRHAGHRRRDGGAGPDRPGVGRAGRRRRAAGGAGGRLHGCRARAADGRGGARAGARRVRDQPRPAADRRHCRTGSPTTSTSRARPTRAGRSRTATTGGPTGATSPRSSSPRCSPSRTPPSSARTASSGRWPWGPRPCCSSTARRAGSPATRTRPRRPAARCGARCSSSPARTTSASTPTAAPLVAELTGGEHVVIEGGGHLPQARDPVKVNLLLRDFLRRLPG